MARVERSVEGTAENDLFTSSKPQMELMAVNKHLAEEKRVATIQTIYDSLAEIWAERGWNHGTVQNRNLYAAIVDRFGWKVLRSEYIAAIRKHAKAGHIHMASSNDDAYIEIK